MADTRVVVADDDPSMAAVLRDLVGSTPGLRCLAVCHRGEDVLEVLARQEVDVLVTDLRMPAGGPGLVEAAVCTQPTTRVLVLTAADRGVQVEHVLGAGASAVISKTRVNDLADAIRRVAAGEVLLAVPGATELVRRIVTGMARPA